MAGALDLEKNTLELVVKSNPFVYFLKRLAIYLPFNIYYDRNLLTALDYAIQTGRYSFVRNLIDVIGKNNPSNKKDFSKILLKNLQTHISETTSDTDDNGLQLIKKYLSLQLIKKYLNRYFDQNSLDYRISKNGIGAAGQTKSIVDLDLDRASRKSKRNYKILYTAASFLLAGLVAFPEAALAIYGGGVFSVAIIFSIGLPAFAVSYFLFRADIYKNIKNWYYPSSKAKSDMDIKVEDKVKKTKAKYFLWFILFFTSLSLSVLLFNSILVPLGVTFFGFKTAAAVMTASFASAPVLFSIAGGFSIAAFFANLALFKSYCYETYVNVIDFINSIKNNVVDKKETKQDLYNSVIKYLKYPFIIISVVTIVAAQQFFSAEAFKLFTQTFGLAKNPSAILANTVSILGVLNGVFYGRNIYLCLTGFINNLVNIKQNTISLWASVKSIFTNDSESLVNKRTVLNTVSYAIFGGLYYCCYVNAVSVAAGVSAIVGGAILAKSVFYQISFASFTGNMRACATEVLPLAAVNNSPNISRSSSLSSLSSLSQTSAETSNCKKYVCYKYEANDSASASASGQETTYTAKSIASLVT